MPRRHKPRLTAPQLAFLDRKLSDRATRQLIRDAAELLACRHFARRVELLSKIGRRFLVP
jgi:hypothetical protein